MLRWAEGWLGQEAGVWTWGGAGEGRRMVPGDLVTAQARLSSPGLAGDLDPGRESFLELRLS